MSTAKGKRVAFFRGTSEAVAEQVSDIGLDDVAELIGDDDEDQVAFLRVGESGVESPYDDAILVRQRLNELFADGVSKAFVVSGNLMLDGNEEDVFWATLGFSEVGQDDAAGTVFGMERSDYASAVDAATAKEATGPVVGTGERVSSFLSEEGWYELSDRLSGNKKLVAYFQGPEVSDPRVDGARVRAQLGALLRKVESVYVHSYSDVLSEEEAETFWSTLGFVAAGQDRDHRPIYRFDMPKTAGTAPRKKAPRAGSKSKAGSRSKPGSKAKKKAPAKKKPSVRKKR